MRNRVVDAVAALGYEPDLLARSLRSGASMTVGYVVADISNPLHSEIALGAEIGLRSAGYTMLLANSMDDADLDIAHIRLFAQRRVDGLLLSTADETSLSTIAALERCNLPGVMIDRDPSALRSMSAVLTDHAAGITDAVATLARLGHRRISLVNGNPSVRPARERAAALRRACRRHGDIKAIVRSGSFTSAHGESATMALLTEPQRPTAIIAGSNQILVGVLRALRDTGTNVPADLSLVTCDDVPLREFLYPPPATIRRDPRAIGSRAAALLLDRLAGGDPGTVTLPTSFHLTESCAAPSGRQR